MNYKVIKLEEAEIRKIAPNKTAYNLITKDINPHISLALIEADNFKGTDKTLYNRIYYVIEGKLTLKFDDKTVILQKGDSCFVEEGTSFSMEGTFKVLNINQPAFGTKS